MNITKCYSELTSLPTFLERFEYLKLNGKVGMETFGHDRYLNQILYHSDRWKKRKRDVIIRDDGCDLGIEGFDIVGSILIHHINPITIEDILNDNPIVFDMENLISTKLSTHNAIHYSDKNMLILPPVERFKNDTCPWRH